MMTSGMSDDVLDEVVESDCSDGLLRSQWAAQLVPDFFDVPERRLLLAVLIDALRLLRTGNPKDQRRVMMWIRGQDARLTFQDVCDGLELDATHVAAHMVGESRAGPVPRRRMGSSRKGQSSGRRRRPIREHVAMVANGCP
jgi:hypothetical protein